jgi:hypothetical protein
LNEAAAQAGMTNNIYQGWGKGVDVGVKPVGAPADMKTAFGSQAAPVPEARTAFAMQALVPNADPAIAAVGNAVAASAAVRPDIQKWMDANRGAARGLDGLNIVERFEKKNGMGRFAPQGGADAAPSPAFAAEAAPAFGVDQQLGVTNTNLTGPQGFFGRTGAAGHDANDPGSTFLSQPPSRRSGDPALEANSLAYGGSKAVALPEVDFTYDWIGRNMRPVGSATGFAVEPR